MLAEIPAIYIVAALLFGLLIGSFLNVCIFRVPRDVSIVVPRSFCPECGIQLAWRDNIPLLSYLLLRGRCRRCRKPIGMRYPIVEVTTAVFFAIITARYGVTLIAFKWAVFESIMIVCFWTDLEERLLLDEFTLGGTVLGLILALLVKVPGPFGELLFSPLQLPLQSLLEAVTASLFLTMPLWLLGWFWSRMRKREALGFGDVKLLPVIASFLGLENGISALLIGSVSGVILGGSYIFLAKKKAGSYELPLGSFFCAGAALIPLLIRS